MKSIIITLSLFCAVNVYAQATQETKYYNTNGHAIKGYDPVSYFVSNKPEKGNAMINHTWSGVKWLFASESNKSLFVNNPEKYAPQYGGYCAYGWAKGYAVKIEPDAWAIEDGKLYLNYNLDVGKDWNKDKSRFIEKANENFNKRKKK